MSRRNQNNQIWFYLFLVLLFVYLFFKFGLRFFVDLAFDVTQGNTTTNNKNIRNDSKISLISEPILEMPNATNEAILIINGKANPDTLIELYNNKEKQLSTNADYEGAFSFEFVLNSRNNQFFVKSTDKYSNKTKESKIYDLTFIEEPPRLELKSPENGSKVYDSQVTIEGLTDKEVFIKINGMPVVTKADGTFSYPFSLNKGDNEIVITAEDVAGNIMEQKITLNYVE